MDALDYVDLARCAHRARRRGELGAVRDGVAPRSGLDAPRHRDADATDLAPAAASSIAFGASADVQIFVTTPCSSPLSV